MKRFLLIAAGTVGGLGAVLSITPPQLSASDTGLTLDLGAMPTDNTATQTPPVADVTPTAAVTTVPETATPVATKSVTTKPVVSKPSPTKRATPSKSATATPAQSQSATSTPTPTKTETPTPTPTKTETPTPTPTPTPTKTETPTPTPTPTKTALPVPTKTATPTPTKTVTPAPVVKADGTFIGPSVNVNYGYVQVEITVSNGKIVDARALQSPSGRSDQYSTYAIPILRQQTLAAQSTTIQGASGASYTTYGWRKSLQGAMIKAGL